MDVARFVQDLQATCVCPIQAQLVNKSEDEGVLYSLEMEEPLHRLEASVASVTYQPTDVDKVQCIDACWTDCADILVRIALRRQYAESAPSCSIEPIALPVFRIVCILVALYEAMESASESRSMSASTSVAPIERWASTMTYACTFYLFTRPSILPSTHEGQDAAQRTLDAIRRRLHLLESPKSTPSHDDIFSRLLPRILSLFASKSSKEDWVATGAAAPRAFAWFIQQVSFPDFTSDVVGRVLALALPLVDQVTASTQAVGLSILHHVIRHATATDVRWYSDLLVHEMEQTLTTASTTAAFLDATLACLVDLLAVLSAGPHDVALYDRFFPSLLRQWDMALDVSVKTVWTRHLRTWVRRMGAPHSLDVLRYLQPVLKVALGCVESVDAAMPMEALDTLRAVVLAAWIRVPAHAEEVAVSILKCLAYNELQRSVPLPGTDPVAKAQHFESLTAKCHAILHLVEVAASPKATDRGRSTVRAVIHHVEAGCRSLAPICARARKHLEDQATAETP